MGGTVGPAILIQVTLLPIKRLLVGNRFLLVVLVAMQGGLETLVLAQMMLLPSRAHQADSEVVVLHGMQQEVAGDTAGARQVEQTADREAAGAARTT